ncbi:hypothetical protein V8F33_013896 [Rhypophila sp. PSN 637]
MPEPYVIGDSSPFLKRVLIPFWVVRIIVMVVLIGIFAVGIAGVASFTGFDGRFENETGMSLKQAKSTVIAIFAVIMVLILICLILDIVCIVKRSRRTLSPRFFLVVNILQTLLWLIFFILLAVGQSTPLGIGIGIIVLLSFLGMLIYASVIFHFFRNGKLGTGGKYQPAYNPELGTAGIANQTPQPYAPNTPYGQADFADVPKPVHYAEAQVSMPQHTGYGQQTEAHPQYAYGQPQQVQQTGYGYELPTRNA